MFERNFSVCEHGPRHNHTLARSDAVVENITHVSQSSPQGLTLWRTFSLFIIAHSPFVLRSLLVEKKQRMA